MPNGLTMQRAPVVINIDDYVDDWPRAIKDLAGVLIKKYGPPNEATASLLLWNENGSWKRTMLHREGVPHNFPRPHIDVLEQVLDFKVPVEKISELTAFDGSLMIDRTSGELVVHCANEEINTLIVNFAHDIVMGTLTAAQARARCQEIARGRLLNWPMRETQELMFETHVRNAERRTADPD